MPTLIVGLGNPGKKYAATRHNVGAAAVEFFKNDGGAAYQDWTNNPRFQSRISSGVIEGGKKVILLLPQTFMNNSGDAVFAASRFWRVAIKDIVIVYDDLDLPVGAIRVRANGSAGGHKGMRSIIERLGTPAIKRVRIGIAGALRDRVPADKYVLERFGRNEKTLIEAAEQKAAEAVAAIVAEGIEAAMNRVNASPK